MSDGEFVARVLGFGIVLAELAVVICAVIAARAESARKGIRR